ncbi:methyltransferase domain-containing protein [Halorussus litoreus]|uniref:class I SAM-dependent methyltransferase n=1 Tax=Halorussus litoreus TaxID=1710536 RepID=UPI001E620879|nr:class I SAM-dependent methyltransferase [Halorussus litoreus]
MSDGSSTADDAASDSSPEADSTSAAAADPFGRAIRDFHRDEQDDPLIQRDSEWAREHPIERFYFGDFDASGTNDAWLADRLDGSLLDLGAGAGRHALYFQEQFETVAVEVSDHLVETMRERGVRDARRADMFALRESFDRDRFASALAIGTQIGLAGSMDGLRRFLTDLAHVTTDDAAAVLDCYDPERVDSDEMLGYRADPTPGLAFRVMQFEYDGAVGETLLFRLFGPDRIREAAVGTDWQVEEVRYDDEGAVHYRVALAKR